MARDRRPALASDITRSWVALGVALVAMVVAPVAIVTLMPGAVEPVELVRIAYFTAWTSFCTVYILESAIAFGRMPAAELHRVLAATNPRSGWGRFWWELNGGGGIWWALLGAGVTFATLLELTLSGGTLTPAFAPLPVVVAIASLALIVVAFAVHYARENAARGGLAFPGEEPPRFVDYLYLAAQVSTTFGGSDVAVTRSAMRRILTVHGAISFVFNTVIVALLVSVLVNRFA